MILCLFNRFVMFGSAQILYKRYLGDGDYYDASSSIQPCCIFACNHTTYTYYTRHTCMDMADMGHDEKATADRGGDSILYARVRRLRRIN